MVRTLFLNVFVVRSKNLEEQLCQKPRKIRSVEANEANEDRKLTISQLTERAPSTSWQKQHLRPPENRLLPHYHAPHVTWFACCSRMGARVSSSSLLEPYLVAVSRRTPAPPFALPNSEQNRLNIRFRHQADQMSP